MKKKIIGIVVCMLLIAAAVLPVAGIRTIKEDEISVTPSVTRDTKIVGESIIEEKSEGASTLSSPIWQWAKSAGGKWDDLGLDICVDSNGNTYIIGDFLGTAFFGPSLSLTSSGNDDVFVAKLNTSGGWQWAVSAGAGGANRDYGWGICVDSNGNTYITGAFEGTANFGPSLSLTSSGDHDVFVAKLNTSGGWQWAKQAGGIDWDIGYGISVDSLGNSYVAGQFLDTATFGTLPPLTSVSKSFDVFVAKLNTSGGWQWAVSAGGASTETGRGISVDPLGNSYVIGQFQDTATFGTLPPLTSVSGSKDVFVAKLNKTGGWQWAVSAGGDTNETGRDISVDSSGNTYITGYFNGSADFGPSLSLTSSGNDDVFVAKLNKTGTTWLWAVSAGGKDHDDGWDISVDSNGNTYITGCFVGTAAFGTLPKLISNGYGDIFVAKLNTSGGWQWAKQAGGKYWDYGWGICEDSGRNIYITGSFMEPSADFGNITLVSKGNYDIFVAKLDQCAGDTTPPVTTHIFTPGTPDGNNGWYKGPGPVTVTLDATDASGIAKTSYSLDGGLNWINYNGPIWPFSFPVSGCIKPGDFQYYSEDVCGNVESIVTVPAFKVDTISPVKHHIFVLFIRIVLARDNCSGLEKIEWTLNGVPWVTDMISPPGTNSWRLKIKLTFGAVTTTVYDMAGNWV